MILYRYWKAKLSLGHSWDLKGLNCLIEILEQQLKKKKELQNDTQTKNEKLKNAHVLHGQWNLIALALNESASRKMMLWDTHSISS